MSCNCSSSVVLPSVADDVSINAGVVTSCVPCSEGICSTDSEGTVLASSWLDACCVNDGMTILGRANGRLARFSGTGFIKLVSGIASVVTSVPFKITDLWNERWKSSTTSRPIIGEPIAFPYLTIAASTGDVHGIKGNSTEDSCPVWSASGNQFALKPLSEQALAQKGLLPRQPLLELVGYTPIVAGGNVNQVRDLSSLTGSGIIVVKAVATVDSTCACVGCEPSPSFASVASFLPNPTTGTVWTLKFNVATGLHFWSAT